MTRYQTRRLFACALAIALFGMALLARAALAQPAGEEAKSLPEIITPWLSMFAIAISVGSVVYAWVTSRSKDNAKALETVSATVGDHEKRIQKMEDELQHLPDREAAHSLELSMMALSGRLDALAERLKPIDAISTRLQEFLLEQARK